MLSDAVTLAINDAINRNLSAEVGTALKERLAQLQELEKELERAQGSLSTCRNKIRDNEVDVQQARLVLSREKALAEAEAKLKTGQDELAHTLAIQTMKVECAERLATQAKEIVGMAFASPVYRASYQHSEHTPIFAPGSTYQSGTHTKQVSGSEERQVR